MSELILDLLEKSGLNWEVSMETLQASDGTSTSAYGIFKKRSRDFLGAVTQKYTPYQNWQLAEALAKASEQVGLQFSRGGELHGGKKVYLQAELPTTFVHHSNVKRYITALSSHDGTTSIGFGSSNTVVVCENTFFRAYRETHRVRHYSTAHGDVMRLASQLNDVIKQDDALIHTFRELSHVSLTDGMVSNLIKDIFGSDFKQSNPRSLDKFNEALEVEVSLAGDNAWGLFNAVTRYTNHLSTSRNKAEYLMTGTGFKLANKALKNIMSNI
jgi:hypothetical protein